MSIRLAVPQNLTSALKALPGKLDIKRHPYTFTDRQEYVLLTPQPSRHNQSKLWLVIRRMVLAATVMAET